MRRPDSRNFHSPTPFFPRQANRDDDLPEIYRVKRTAEAAIISQLFRYAGTSGTPALRRALSGGLTRDDFESETPREIYFVTQLYFQKYGTIPADHEYVYLFKNGASFQGVQADQLYNDYLALSDFPRPDAMIEGDLILIKDRAFRRRAQRLSSNLGAELENLPERVREEEVSALFEKFRGEMDALESQGSQKHIFSLSDVCDSLFQEIADGNEARILPTPFATLNDYLNGGFKTGEIILLSAQAGTGKTAFLTQILAEMGGAGICSLFFSLEMTKEEILKRIATQTFRVNLFQTPPILADRPQFKGLAALPIRIVDTPSSMDLIAQRIRETKHSLAAGGQTLALAAIDYLDMIDLTAEEATMPEYERLSALMIRLKKIAKEERIALLVVTQLNRENQISGSGRIIRTADAALRLSADEDQPTDSELADLTKMTLEIDKNRNGRRGAVSFDFNGKWFRFFDGGERKNQSAWRRSSEKKRPQCVASGASGTASDALSEASRNASGASSGALERASGASGAVNGNPSGLNALMSNNEF